MTNTIILNPNRSLILLKKHKITDFFLLIQSYAKVFLECTCICAFVMKYQLYCILAAIRHHWIVFFPIKLWNMRIKAMLTIRGIHSSVEWICPEWFQKVGLTVHWNAGGCGLSVRSGRSCGRFSHSLWVVNWCCAESLEGLVEGPSAIVCSSTLMVCLLLHAVSVQRYMCWMLQTHLWIQKHKPVK